MQARRFFSAEEGRRPPHSRPGGWRAPRGPKAVEVAILHRRHDRSGRPVIGLRRSIQIRFRRRMILMILVLESPQSCCDRATAPAGQRLQGEVGWETEPGPPVGKSEKQRAEDIKADRAQRAIPAALALVGAPGARRGRSGSRGRCGQAAWNAPGDRARKPPCDDSAHGAGQARCRRRICETVCTVERSPARAGGVRRGLQKAPNRVEQGRCHYNFAALLGPPASPPAHQRGVLGDRTIVQT